MTDIAKEFIKKIFNIDKNNSSTITINGKTIETNSKGKILNIDKILNPHEKLQAKVDIEEQTLKNKIKLKALKSVTNEDLNKAFEELNIEEYISSIITLRVAESVKSQSYRIVAEALEDLEDTYEIKRAIKTSVINKIQNAFKI